MYWKSPVVLFLFAIGCFAAPNPLDPMTKAVLENDIASLQAAKAQVNTKLAHGNTPLMYAGAYGTLDGMKLLVEQGADVNAQNDIGATALMLSISDASKASFLISKGAEVNTKSKTGRTALLIAAMTDGTADTIKLLLSKGADPKAVDSQGLNMLMSAASSGNTPAVKLALEKQVPVNAKTMEGNTALMAAAADGNLEAVKLLIKAGADVNAVSGDPSFKLKNGVVNLGRFTPLLLATSYGPAPVVKVLIDAGADVNAKDARGFTPLHMALTSEAQNPEIVRMLIEKGAKTDVTTVDAESPADWALKFRNPKTMALLKVSAPSAKQDISPGSPELRAAVQKSLDLLEKTSTSFAREGGCVSCHHQNITSMATSVGRSHGFHTDQAHAEQRTGLAMAFLGSMSEGFPLRIDPPGSFDTEMFALFGLAADQYPPDVTTAAITRNIAMNQRRDGSWETGGIARVPIEDSSISRTAMAIRCLQLFQTEGTRAEYTQRINRGRAWLLKSTPNYLEEANLRLLSLKWSGADATAVSKAAAAILAKQAPSGGWSQNGYLAEDTYATGQALYALHEAGGLATSDPAYRKGVAYLLSTQLPDGSWHVRSRAAKFQAYFQSGFPHDHDQWISSAATGWAAMALALAAEPAQRASR
jgi:ankyrin repeat protein